jgi:hypothetical protein
MGYWPKQAARHFKIGHSHAKFNGIGGLLTHISFVPGRPRHKPQDGLSLPPELGPFLLARPNSCALMHWFREISPMRVFLALALSLAGYNGDRIKQVMNGRQAQPQSAGLLT